jgi:DNA-binding MarR family transcriptional regulator
MATKLDKEKRLYVGPTAVRENTVVDHIRKAVNELGGAPGGDGVTYADLEKHLLENFQPKKSQGYGASYIGAYVRDGVNRYGHLTHEADKAVEYSSIAAPEPKAKTPKAKKLTKAQQAEIDALNFVRQRGEVSDAADLDNTQITVQDFVTETGKKTKTVTTQIDKLEKDGLVRTETRGEGDDASRYVFLTQAGFARLQEIDSQDTGEPTAATGADGGAVE